MSPLTPLERQNLIKKVEKIVGKNYEEFLRDNLKDAENYRRDNLGNLLILYALDRTKNLGMLLEYQHRLNKLFDLSNHLSTYLVFEADTSKVVRYYMEDNTGVMPELLKRVLNKSELKAVELIYENKGLLFVITKLESEEKRRAMVKMIAAMTKHLEDNHVKDLVLDLYALLKKEDFESLLKATYLNFGEIHRSIEEFRNIISYMDIKNRYIAVLSFGRVKDGKKMRNIIDELRSRYDVPIGHLLRDAFLLARIENEGRFYNEVEVLHRKYKKGYLTWEEYMAGFDRLVWKFQTYVPKLDMPRPE